MDRNREARRATNMAAPPNGLLSSSSSSRRRHRSTRDSPDEDGGGVEIQERLRDRGVAVVKKDRDRDRERSIRSKRRRENRLIHQNHNSNNNNNNSNRDRDRDRDEDDTSEEESVNDEEGEDEDDAGNGASVRMLPPPPTNPLPNNNNNHQHHQNNNSSNNHHHHRKTFPPSANKVFRSAPAAPPPPPPPAWKAAADEMIGVSVPRKARSASTKRSHEWISAAGGGVGGHEQINRQLSTSPVNLSSSPAPLAAPPSPSSSNISVRKKMKAANGGVVVGGSKPRPPKSSSKSSSSNPEELEIEIAEVLYGLMTQSQAAPSKKENDSNNKSSSDNNNNNKSRVSSPISNSTPPLQNPTSLSTVAPKRKRPRQVSENPFSRSSSVSPSVKNEIDHHHQSPKTDLEDNCQVSAAAVAGENSVPFGFTSLPSDPPLQKPEQDGKCGVDVGLVLTKQEVEKKSHAVGLNDGNKITQTVIATPASVTMTNIKAANLETTSQKEEKFEIDLMAPPPQQRTSPERDEEVVAFSDHKQMATQEACKNKEEEKLRKIGKDDIMNLMIEEQKKSKTGSVQETGDPLTKQQVMNEDRNIGLHIDLEKPNKDSSNVVSGSNNRSLHQALKHQQLSAKSETHTEKTAQPSSMQMPMSVANWPPMGYVAPLQGVISMDGNTMPSAPIQPIFTHPRPKRCATHCYIARNIHYLQQFMKINPFWPAASGSAPMFGAKPCGLNVTELGHGNIPQSTQEKGGLGVNIFPGHTAGKDNKSSQGTTIPDSAQRKQQVLLQPALPPVTPNNILHGPAFIFPFNQQQAVAAASASASASVRPGSSKVNNSSSTAGAVGLGQGASNSANSATVGASATAAAPALSFNYPNMSANETQYLAILQNNPYSFPIPAVGAPPNYRGNPHGQPMPLFNGSFYSSQMIHPSQIPQPPQQQAPPSQSQSHHPSQSQQISQTHQNSSGSTSSSQRQHQQQRQQQGSGVAVNGGGSLHNSYPVSHKSRSQPSQQMNPPPPQARHLENEVTGGEDSPSTADSRVSRAANTMSVYGHNFAMPVHSQNFALMNPQAALSNATASGNSNDKKHQQQSQQQGSKRSGGSGLESSSLPPQTFAMSFAPMNGTTGAMAQNHAIFQSLPESVRQSYQHMIQTAPPSAHHSQQKKDFRVSEEASRTINHDSSNAEEERKGSSGMTGKSGQSIAFSRPDLSTDASGSSSILGTSVIDSSSRNINLGSNNNRSSRSPISSSVASAQSSHHHLHAQFQQQQQVLQLQKQQQQQQQQQQNMSARSKNPVSNNGSAYPDHLMTSSSSMAAAKFPNPLSSFPQNLVQTANVTTSPGQSPQWRNSARGGPTTSQVPSSLSSATASSLKNLHQSHQAQQQQSSRPHPQSHTQISFGNASQKHQLTTSLQMQQQQNQNLGSNSSNQCPSPPMLVGSPTTSTISKGGGGGGSGSPRTNAGSASTSGRAGQASSLSSSQQAKNSPVGTQRSSPSILGNPHNPNSTKSQQQLPKQTLQQQQAQAQAQAHVFFQHPFMQVPQSQAQQHSGGSTTASGYYLSRKQQQLPQSSQPQQSSSSSSSTAMLSLCPPVTLANTATTTSDPAKAIAAATSNLKGGVGQGILHAAQYGGATQSSMPAGFPQYNAHNNAPASVQVKHTEQKQPAGNDTLRTWQPEKK